MSIKTLNPGKTVDADRLRLRLRRPKLYSTDFHETLRRQNADKRAPLVNTRQINFELTTKSHFDNFTSFPGHVLTGKCRNAYQPICIVGLNTSNVFLLLFNQESYLSKVTVKQKTAGDHS